MSIHQNSCLVGSKFPPWKNRLIRAIVQSKDMTLSEKARRLRKVMHLKGEQMTQSELEGARRRLLKSMVEWHKAEHAPRTLVDIGPAKIEPRAASAGSTVGYPVLDTDTAQFKLNPFKMGGVAPPGMEALVRKLKKNPSIKNPWAVAWAIYQSKKRRGKMGLEPVGWPPAGNRFKFGYEWLPGGGRFRRYFGGRAKSYEPGGGWRLYDSGRSRHVPGNVGAWTPDPFKMGANPGILREAGQRFVRHALYPFAGVGSKTRYWTPGGGVFYPRGRGYNYYPGGGWHKQGRRWVHTHVGDSALACGEAPNSWMVLRAKQRKRAAKVCAAAKAGHPKAQQLLKAIQAAAARGDQRAQFFLKDCAQAAVIQKASPIRRAKGVAPMAHSQTHSAGISAMEQIAGL